MKFFITLYHALLVFVVADALPTSSNNVNLVSTAHFSLQAPKSAGDIDNKGNEINGFAKVSLLLYLETTIY